MPQLTAMRELLELQTGQVAFISGLMSGFSLSIAVHVLRYGIRTRVAQAVFLMFLLSSLLFLIALYVDVRLSIALAGVVDAGAKIIDPLVFDQIAFVRNLGTSSATVALVIFMSATGLLGWLGSPSTGVASTIIAVAVMGTLWFVWFNINTISLMLAS